MFFGQSRVPAGMRVYAIGDVHGHADRLAALLGAIDAELDADPPAAHRIVALGDYCDRGPDTRGVLDQLIARSAADPDTICILGNHDQLMLDMLTDPHEAAPSWLTWGGIQTLAAYGIGGPGLNRDIDALSARFAQALPAAHRAFLENLRPMHLEGDYVFVHAGLMPEVALGDQRVEHLIWIREPFLDYRGSFGRVVVHGHTIHERPTVLPNRIAVDTGVFQSGRLTCAVLEDDRCRFIVAHADGVSHASP